MAESFIGVMPDGSGKAIDAFSFMVGGQLQYRQSVAIGDPTAGGLVANVTVNSGGVGALNSALFDGAGNALSSNTYSGQISLCVDTSTAATDGSTYGAWNVPQVDIIAGRGSDGLIHAVQVDATGRPAVTLSDNGFLDMIASDLAAGDGQSSSSWGLMRPPGYQADGSEWSLTVQVSPNTPLVIDQSQAVITGGVSPSGANVRNVVGADGGTRLTDAPAAIINVVGTVGQGTGWIDTTGYQSIVVTFTNASGSTFLFQSTNDPAVPVAGGNAGGWPIAGASSPVTTLASPSAGATWVFPVTARWFRVYCSAYSTQQYMTTYLRAAPCPFMPTNASVTVGGTTAVNASQVGGSTLAAAGSASSTTPMLVGGADAGGLARKLLTDTNGNVQHIGYLPVGFQYGALNVSYGTYTQALTTMTVAQSTAPPVLVGGTDQASAMHRILTDQFGAVQVGSAPSNQANQSIQELLFQVVGLLKVIAQYDYDIRSATIGSYIASDEPDNMLADFVNPATNFQNYNQA